MLDLTPTARPIFASRSRVNGDSKDFGTLFADSMDALVNRIIDGDPLSIYHSEFADDTETVTITASFHIRGALTPQTFDLVAMQNINLKNFLLEVSDNGGSTYSTVPGFDFQVGTADNADTDIIKETLSGSPLSPITANFMRLSMFRTIGFEDRKRIGGIYLAQSIVQPTRGMRNYDKRFRQMSKIQHAGDGSISEDRVLRSAASYEHYGAAIRFAPLPASERDTIRDIKRLGDPVTWIPEPFTVPRDVFTVRMPGAWRDRYVSRFKGAGYELMFNLEEAGRL